MQMKYKLLGRSGLRVSELSLGALTFGEEWGQGADWEESKRVFDAYAEAGGNFIDTANKYNNGTSEAWTADFMGAERDRFVLATKYSLSMREDDPNASGNHRKNMIKSLEDSLRRLKTDYIDLYWLHQWDNTTPVEEVMRALDDLVSQGKVHYIGISDVPAWIVSQANTLAELRGWTRFVALQIEYSLIERTPERDLLPMARAFDLAVLPWGILGQSVLTGKYNKDPQNPEDSRRSTMAAARLTERNLAIAREVEAIADELGKTPSQVAIAWVRQQAPYIIPIVGARTARQLHDNLEVLNFSLDAQQLQRLDELSAIVLGFPYDFNRRERIIRQRYGDSANLIEGLEVIPGWR